MPRLCLFLQGSSMFKIQFCGTIAHKCLVSPLFSTTAGLLRNQKQIVLASNEALPEKSRITEGNSRRKPRLKNGNPFPQNTIRSRDAMGLHSADIESTHKESEQEFLVRVKNNPDIFGNNTTETEYQDEGDILEERYLTEQPSPHKKLNTKQYADMIKSYIQQRKIKEAIDVVEIRMLKEDKVKPENYLYNLLLGACGRVGYTKKAFMLYNDMKKRGLKVTGGTYTALFNACANSPWPLTDGLTRAKHLYDIMIEKGDQPNDTNYNAMIKAFGRCGDLSMAFTLVDEMSQRGFIIKDDTINFLLQACVTDKDTGFRHSLLVWRKLIQKNIRPSVYTFNLILRCVRDCGLGDIETTKDIINTLVGEGVNFEVIPEPKRLELTDSEEMNREGPVPTEISLENLDGNELDVSNSFKEESLVKSIGHLELRPNLLAPKPHLGNILSLSEVKRPEDKLLLLGGCKGFLETMSRYKCTPDIKTFTQLLDSIPSTPIAEKELILAMKRNNVQADVDFYNMLIKKKSLRLDYAGAREVLTSMKQTKLRPDIITYGVLSLGCKTKEEALDLVNQMNAAGYTLNAAILGAMLKQACFHMNFSYIFEIMELCLKESVPANKMFVEHLKSFKEKCRVKLDAKELKEKQVKLFGIFKARYKTWLTEVQIDESEDVHPWQQYRQTYPQNVKFKPKDTARFKPRRTSLFKVKTSTKHRNMDH